jgi:uncharacterized protein (TIGR00290 family)
VRQRQLSSDPKAFASKSYIEHGPFSKPTTNSNSEFFVMATRYRLGASLGMIRCAGENMNKAEAWMSWSSGKDSAWALHTARQQGNLEVTGLLTTVNITHGRVAMHAVRELLLEQQAEALSLPLVKIPLPWPCSNEIYERAMLEAIGRARAEGVTHLIFGDLFLEDVRRYREERLLGTGVTPVFPLWGRHTAKLAREMIEGGVKAWLTCVNPQRLDGGFAGRIFNDSLIEDLPEAVDPCGENGEFHTFVADAPGFRAAISVVPGETVERDGFVFADLLPSGK